MKNNRWQRFKKWFNRPEVRGEMSSRDEGLPIYTYLAPPQDYADVNHVIQVDAGASFDGVGGESGGAGADSSWSDSGGGDSGGGGGSE